MKTRFILLLLLLFPMLAASGKGLTGGESSSKHELRFGIGDMFFETLIWNNQIHKDYNVALPGTVFPEKRDYFYTPHLSGEYAFHILPWLSLGGTVDFQHTGWKNHMYGGGNREVSVTGGHFSNVCIMPTVRFNYFRRGYVGLYSALSVGLDINSGTETDSSGRHVGVGAAADLRIIGISVGNGNWWGFAELGGTYALRNKDCMYLMNSQIIKIGVSYKFQLG